MKKVITVMAITVLSVVFLTSGVWAKDNMSTEKGTKASKSGAAVTNEKNDSTVDEEVTEEVTEKATEEVTGEATEKGQKDKNGVQVRNWGQDKKIAESNGEKGNADLAKNYGQYKKYEKCIRVKGRNMKFNDDSAPVIKEGRTLIPVRAIMNGLGAQVDYDAETKIVTISRDDKEITLNLDTGETFVNDELITIDVPDAKIINNRTFVPLRFIAQTLGEKVDYDDETGEINIGDEEATDEEATDEDVTDEEAADDTSGEGI
ncbi:MAG: copper amine oxidase N-terminal domain-containing protein [Clostridia bacterium]|nr:copper amine oxidase N-terminal domain-containing protein [Clostridia bacterium]MDD4047409.1 copper amine oxidase N-terminal domain-containing protein [Clostridia bacterium]